MSVGTGGFLQPEEIVKQLNIKKNITIADFGCGGGYVSIPLAKIAEQGKIYALDILKEALEAVQSRAKLEGVLNIETIHCNLELENGSTFENNSIDLVILANILFQSSNKDAIIKEAKRVVKKSGQIVIIDWKLDQAMGPPNNLVIDLKAIKELGKEQGLKLKKELPVDQYHWGVIFNK